jgi:hypothetical protein
VTAATTATATATPTTTAVATNTAKEVKMQHLGEWVAPQGRTTGGGGSPRIYMKGLINAVSLKGRFWFTTSQQTSMAFLAGKKNIKFFFPPPQNKTSHMLICSVNLAFHSI